MHRIMSLYFVLVDSCEIDEICDIIGIKVVSIETFSSVTSGFLGNHWSYHCNFYF